MKALPNPRDIDEALDAVEREAREILDATNQARRRGILSSRGPGKPTQVGYLLERAAAVDREILRLAARSHRLPLPVPTVGERFADPPPGPKAPPGMVLLNGRDMGSKGTFYICAKSKADAARLLHEEFGLGRSVSSWLYEFRHFFSTCWGSRMAGVQPERGLWHSPSDHEPPRRVHPNDPRRKI